MRVLLLGSGGRENALAWRISQSPKLEKLFIAPGNGGSDRFGETVEMVVNRSENFPEITRFCIREAIDLVVVGPEAPLVEGLVDFLENAGILCFGPTKAASALEGSKDFAKSLMKAAGVATAEARTFDSSQMDAALSYAKSRPVPLVIKADGLAAGKGVLITQSRKECETAIRSILHEKRFGPAGEKILIEDHLEGEELSFFALCDGKSALPLATAQDHKRAFDGDKGPNTGGMGAFSPAKMESPELIDRLMVQVVHPILKEMQSQGTPFKGVLFVGIMMTGKGPRVLEFNTRFGDPECQALMMRMESDLLELLLAAATTRLEQIRNLNWSDEPALSLVIASKGYPGDYEKAVHIPRLAELETYVKSKEGCELFHAGTKKGERGEVLACGGRVLNIVVRAPELSTARTHAYDLADRLDWQGGFFRRDIGRDD